MRCRMVRAWCNSRSTTRRSAGLAVWNGEVHNLTINGGLVSTLLGSKAALDGVDFNLDLYLEITIDANTDGQISLSDPPLLPRQSILPAVFAWESADSQLLQGYDWSALFGPDNPADGTLLPAKIADSSLATAKLGDSAVTAAKIANGAVTRPKIDTTGASAGQSLTYDGTSVVWNQVNALNAETLDGFDWATIFTGANPASGTLNVASVASRGSVSAASDLSATGTLTVGGRSFLNGPSTTVSGALTAVNITSTTDITAFRAVWAQSFNQTSDRDAKENFSAIAPGDVLAKVATLPIARWNYRDDPDAQHLGPVSQDFHAAFGLGSDDKSIATVDADGVALAAIQGLHQLVKEKDARIAEMEDRLATLEQLVSGLKGQRLQVTDRE
jgi:hypothetical protein